MKKFLFLFLFLALSYRDVIAAGPIIMNPGGQALSSTDSPTFAGLTLNGALVMGANSIQFTDSTLIRDAANVLALRNGVNAQQLSIYNTFTDASNYERLELLWSSNTATIRAAAAGTGTLRNLNFTPAGLASTIAIQVVGNSGNPSLYFATYARTTPTTLGRVDFGNLAANTSTSGTSINVRMRESFSPTATSTMLAESLSIEPTINYSNATPGAGSYRAINIAVTETALPTGTNYLLYAAAGAAGTTEMFSVTNAGELKFAGVSGDADTSALCKKADDTIGVCSSVVGATGLCTCG